MKILCKQKQTNETDLQIKTEDMGKTTLLFLANLADRILLRKFEVQDQRYEKMPMFVFIILFHNFKTWYTMQWGITRD